MGVLKVSQSLIIVLFLLKRLRRAMAILHYKLKSLFKSQNWRMNINKTFNMLYFYILRVWFQKQFNTFAYISLFLSFLITTGNNIFTLYIYTSCTLTIALWKLTSNRYDVIYHSGCLVMYWMHQTTASVRYYTTESNAHTFPWHTRVTSHFMVIWLSVLNEHWLLLGSQNCPVLANITWSIDKNSSALVIIKLYIYSPDQDQLQKALYKL